MRSPLVLAPNLALIEGDREWPAQRLLDAASELSEKLHDTSGVALVGSGASQVAIAVLAAANSGTSLMLLREPRPMDDPLWARCGIDALLLGESVQRIGDPGEKVASIILATSGTTGEPKVIRHSWERLLGRIRPPQAASEARWLLTFHPASFAGLQVLLTALVHGGTLIAADSPTVPGLAEAALSHSPTHVSATPTFWRALLLALGPRSSEVPLRQITVGGEAVDQPTLDALRLAFPNARVSHIYASTEAGSLFSVHDGVAGFPSQWLQTGIEGVDLRVVDSVLHVRSPRAMSALLAGTVPVQEGWLHTGDRVELSGDRVVFVGREDSVINVGGAKVSPEEVESALLALPEIAEVRIFGKPNPVTGYLVSAEIVSAAGSDEADVRAAIQRLTADWPAAKRPRVLSFVANIETTATGKKGRT